MLLATCLALFLFSGADLGALHRERDFAWFSDARTGREEIIAGRLELVLVPGFPTVLVNGMPRRLQDPPRLSGGRLFVPEGLAGLIRENAPVRTRETPVPEKPEPAVEPFPGFSIVIDPGHGGIHTGCGRGGDILEKDIVLDVSLRLRDILEAGGVRVTMTRTTDRHLSEDLYTDLQCRCDVANRVKPDLFLSIHANWVSDPIPRGFEVWVPKQARGWRDRESRTAADCILRELRRVIGGYDRGVKDEKNLYVLRKTTCPAVLAELEFLSNPQGKSLLTSPSVRQRLAEALAEAMRRFVARAK